MYRNSNSDYNTKMAAASAFDSILNQVKLSNLNFYMELSPFSAVINLKKSLIQDKSGIFMIPPLPNTFLLGQIKLENLDLYQKVKQLENDLVNSKNQYEEAVNDCENAIKTIATLEEYLKEAQVKYDKCSDFESNLAVVKFDSSIEIKNLTLALEKEIETSKSLKNKVKYLQIDATKFDNEITCANKAFKSKDKIIYNLERKSDNLNETIEKLKVEIGSLKADKVDIQRELKNIKKNNLKEAKKQISSSSLNLSLSTTSSLHSMSCIANNNNLQPTLSISNSHPLKLQPTLSCTTTNNLLDNLSISTFSNLQSTVNSLETSRVHTSFTTLKSVQSILTNPIHPWNNIPLKTPSNGVQCSNRCEHSSQCIIRQPRSPPFPSITYLINETSNYHVHMMTWSSKEFAGCWRCFSVENENYGCKDCQWLKWWFKWHGELHGYPDVIPSVYAKYL